MPTKAQISIAYHEAGHAVAAYVHDFHIEAASLREGRDQGELPYSGFVLTGSLTPETYTRLASESSGEALDALKIAAMDQIEFLLAGWVAEHYYQEKPEDGGFLGDFIKICDLLSVMLDVPASEIANDSDDSLLKHLIESTQYLIETHWKAVTAVARALLNKTELTGDEVRQIIRNALETK